MFNSLRIGDILSSLSLRISTHLMRYCQLGNCLGVFSVIHFMPRFVNLVMICMTLAVRLLNLPF